jgi:hypothetical protein
MAVWTANIMNRVLICRLFGARSTIFLSSLSSTYTHRTGSRWARPNLTLIEPELKWYYALFDDYKFWENITVSILFPYHVLIDIYYIQSCSRSCNYQCFITFLCFVLIDVLYCSIFNISTLCSIWRFVLFSTISLDVDVLFSTSGHFTFCHGKFCLRTEEKMKSEMVSNSNIFANSRLNSKIF